MSEETLQQHLEQQEKHIADHERAEKHAEKEREHRADHGIHDYIGHEIAFDPAAFEEDLMLLRAIPETDEPALRAKLREMVPTFHAPDGQTLPQEATVG